MIILHLQTYYFIFFSVGKSVNFAIILATLVIDGKKHGMHPFLTQLRSMEDHKPLPGREVKRMYT